ncbi:hypothetical protein V6N13_113568 [Hibiscus sabdariffa]
MSQELRLDQILRSRSTSTSTLTQRPGKAGRKGLDPTLGSWLYFKDQVLGVLLARFLKLVSRCPSLEPVNLRSKDATLGKVSCSLDMGSKDPSLAGIPTL